MSSLWQRLQSKNLETQSNEAKAKEAVVKEESNTYEEQKESNVQETVLQEGKEEISEAPVSTESKPNHSVDYNKKNEIEKKLEFRKTNLNKSVISKVKNNIQDELVKQISNDELKKNSGNPEFEKKVYNMIVELMKEQNLALTKDEKDNLAQIILDDSIGFGAIQPLVDDESISEIMVNRKEQIYVEQLGKLILTDLFFNSDEEILKVADRILSPLNRRVDETTPYVDARLPDGSRVNIIIPPLAVNGPCITIRKFGKDSMTIDDLIRHGTVSAEMAQFIDACVKARLNIVVSGGTGSGKTTTLNVLSSFIPSDERIVTIEDAAELQLKQPHVITLEARAASANGNNAVPIRQLVVNSLRMRPDRIVVGEVRSGEAIDMLQAMNTGHDGSMTTGHANTPRDMLARLETMVLMSGIELPLSAIRQQIASAVDVIIQQSRMKDGTRKITSITEVQGMEGEFIVLQPIFEFKQTGYDANGKILGDLKPTGIRPSFFDVFKLNNIDVPNTLFQLK